MRSVPVGRTGLVSIVDDEDYDLVAAFTWHRSESHGNVYARRSWRVAGICHRQRMHSLITGWPLVDHGDHDGLNNTRANLRQATNADNAHNQRIKTGGTSVFKGVSWQTAKAKWKAQIVIDYRVTYLGLFDDEREAARTYNKAARARFGEFALVNEGVN